VILDLEAGLLADAGEKRPQVIAIEDDSPSASLTEKKVLVPNPGFQECLTALLLMDPLDESQFLKFLQRAINGHQSKMLMFLARCIKDLNGSQRVN
jgi:hypothetical protein